MLALSEQSAQGQTQLTEDSRGLRPRTWVLREKRKHITNTSTRQLSSDSDFSISSPLLQSTRVGLSSLPPCSQPLKCLGSAHR